VGVSYIIPEEYVTYPIQPQNPGFYKWTSPPYTADTLTPNPATGLTPVSATTGNLGLQDFQGNVGFLPPYAADTVTSNQVFQFQCTNYKPGQWTQLFPRTGTIAITRTVQNVNGKWQYTISKSGTTNTGILP